MRKALQLSIFVFFLSAATTVFSQSKYATLSGTVFDPQQKALPGCTVQLTSGSTRASRQSVTNELGSFQITGLAPGNYELFVQAQGFATVTQNITLEVGQSMTLDLNLKLASVSSVVDIEADAMNLLKTADASVGEVVEPTSVQNLPLNGRMLIDLVLTVPGEWRYHLQPFQRASESEPRSDKTYQPNQPADHS